MSTSPVVPIPVTNGTDRARDSSKRRTRKKFQKQLGDDKNQSVRSLCNDDYQSTQWKSEAQQQVYRTKLLQALRQVRQRSVTGSGAGTAIRETADRVLAVTAKGRTRWSRAILTNKLKLKFLNRNRRERGLIVTATGNSRLRKPKVRILKLKRKNSPVVKKNNLPAVQRKTRVLGGLVPGCQKQPLPVVLKEATDYIPALEMQVKAMAALVELLSGGSGSGSVNGAGHLGRLSFSRPPPCV